MRPEKADEFLALLTQPMNKGDNITPLLHKLYKDTEHSREAVAFRSFLNEHDITFLGGGHSKNFKISRDDESEYVLKVDDRLNRPKSVEAHLRNTLGSSIALFMLNDKYGALVLRGKHKAEHW